MAKYTIELREIVENNVNIFDFDYPFYDDTKKPDFEKQFIEHFYFKEIGFETTGRFKHYLKTTFHEKLPYYNMLLETSVYEYDLKNNYNLTETFTKNRTASKDINGNINQIGNSKNDTTSTGNSSSNRDATVTGNKENTLNSESNHEQTTNSINDTVENETNSITKNTELNTDNTTVESNTPQGLLAMADIKKNVYASKVSIDDNLNKTVDEQTGEAQKTGKTTENVNGNSTDTVTGRSSDTTFDKTIDKLTENNTNTITTTGDLVNNTVNNQNEQGNETESYTLERVGDIGVDTTPDKLKKHIELQKILTTVYLQFFNECEDLFMQIY